MKCHCSIDAPSVLSNPVSIFFTATIAYEPNSACSHISSSYNSSPEQNLPLNISLCCVQYVSRYEGDLVAKCYFAKHKLVWEVLEGGLKSKIEIQWSDITALKATCPENGQGTLDVVVCLSGRCLLVSSSYLCFYSEAFSFS